MVRRGRIVAGMTGAFGTTVADYTGTIPGLLAPGPGRAARNPSRAKSGDPGIRLALHRTVRMLGYAADTLRGAVRLPRRARRPAGPPPLLLGLLVIAGLVTVVWDIWDTVRAPGHWLNYVLLAWAVLLVASPAGQYFRPGARMTAPILVCSSMAGVVVCSWNAVQAPLTG